jgi:hypothetical protein
MLATAALALAGPGTATAQAAGAGPAAARALAASCDGPRERSASAPGSHRFAQTFQPRLSGALTSAEVEVTKAPGSSGNWVMQVISALRIPIGAPSEEVVASATIPDSTVPVGPSTIAASFPEPARVSAGIAPRREYELVVTRPGATDLTVGYREGNDCPGQLLRASAPVGSLLPFGGADNDLVFRAFVSDDVPPQTRIVDGPRRRTPRHRARFVLEASEAVAGYECRLDREPFADCGPREQLRVGRGRHRFRARATDEAGNADPTPARFRWRVLR